MRFVHPLAYGKCYIAYAHLIPTACYIRFVEVMSGQPIVHVLCYRGLLVSYATARKAHHVSSTNELLTSQAREF